MRIDQIFLRTDIPNFISKSINSRKHDSYCLAVSPLFPRINVSLLINAGPRFTHTAEQKKKRVGLERGLVLLSSRSSSSTRGYTFTNDFWTGKKEQGLFFGSIYICVCVHCISGLGSLVIFLSPRRRIFMREGAICVVSGRVF